MNEQKTVLILYPVQADQKTGQKLKLAFEAEGSPVDEMVIENNTEQVLDRLMQPVLPVVICQAHEAVIAK